MDDALVVRMAVCRPDKLGPWPDLTGPDGPATWRPWLHQALRVPGFAAALTHATSGLAERVNTALGSGVSQAETRRLVLSVMRYLLRAVTRPTPYGLFAGVAPAVAARAGAVHVGTAHRPVVRVRAAWLSAVYDKAEADVRLRPHLLVRVNNLLVQRGSQLVLEHRAGRDPRGAPTHVRVRATRLVRAALGLATDPIRWRDLTAKIGAECGVPQAGADRLIGQLVSQGLLVTNLRPPVSIADPLSHLVDQMEALDAEGKAGELMTPLRHIRDLKVRHDTAPDAATAEDRRRDLDASMAALAEGAPSVGVDLRVDCDLVLPRIVTAEACRAAAVLTRVARPSTIGWADWHARFLDRYGLHALVPVRDVVDADVGLGYPAGFTGAVPAAPAAVTDRDRTLLALAQRAALHREREMLLTDRLLDTLAGPAPTPIAPFAELTVRVHASSIEAIGNGDFVLSVARAAGHAFGTAGRFVDLFDDSDQRRIATRAADQSGREMLLAQLSSVTRYGSSLDVARARQVLPYRLPVGEYHATAPDIIGLDDIAVTADARRLYLVSISRHRVVLPVQVNALERVQHTLPIARFLAEAPAALATSCSPFDWGPAARDLPFLPAIRYGRTLLSHARWKLSTTDLPERRASWRQWDQALTCWLRATGCPPEVCLGVGDQTIGLALDIQAHRALLRDHLTRHASATLRAIAGDNTWIGGHPHEVVIPLAAAAPTPTPPRLGDHVVQVREHGVPPGDPNHQYLKVYARPDPQTIILTDYLPALLDQLSAGGTWWFQRFVDPNPHLRLRLRGLPVHAIATWSRELLGAGLSSRIQWDTDVPEPGRFGGPAAYAETVKVFAVDSAAVLAQLAITSRRDAPDWRALTAASMVDLTTAVIGAPYDAMRWLVRHTQTHRPAPDRAVYDQAVHLANPHERSALAALPGGEHFLSCWQQRRHVVAGWRDVLPALGATAPAELLPDLLHLHHVRIAGPDLNSERACLHLARAAALSWTTRSQT